MSPMPSPSPWLLWNDLARPPAMNMAIDELLVGAALEAGLPILRTYGWDRPAASFGYSQAPAAVLRESFETVRRPTGGGVVYHDADLTYTLAIPAGHPLSDLDRMESYKALHEAILLAMASLGVRATLAPESLKPHDRATLQCFKSPSPHDVLVEGGAKLAGAAQRRTRQGILHQGSVALAAAPGSSREAIGKALEKACSEKFGAEFSRFIPGEKLLDSAAKLADLKYATEAWNVRKESPPALN